MGVGTRKKKALTREDVLGQLWRLASGRANDVAKLVFLESEELENVIEKMDLTAMAELKRCGNGAVEVKAVDRLRALELLLALLDGAKEGGDDGAVSLYQALEAHAGEAQNRETSDPRLLPETDRGADMVV